MQRAGENFGYLDGQMQLKNLELYMEQTEALQCKQISHGFKQLINVGHNPKQHDQKPCKGYCWKRSVNFCSEGRRTMMRDGTKQTGGRYG